MKKVIATLLTAAIAVSMISGCNKNKLTEDPTDTTSSSDTATDTSSTWEPQNFDELYGNQLPNYLNHQYYFDGKAVPMTESNYYFINSFIELANTVSQGYYTATTMGYLDLSAACPEGSGYATYGDYFVAYAESKLSQALIVNARAEAEGMSLTEEAQKNIDEVLGALAQKASNSGKTYEEYLKFWYGPEMTEESFREIYEREYLAGLYSKWYAQNYEPQYEDKYFHNIRYVLFWAPEDPYASNAGQAPATEEEKAAALASANEMLNKCTSLDDITTLGQEAVDLGIAKESNDIVVNKYGSRMVPDFEAWAYDESRKEGDMAVIYASYGYFVVGYVGREEQPQSVYESAAMTALSQELLAEAQGGTHDLHTDDPYLASPPAPTPTTAPST